MHSISLLICFVQRYWKKFTLLNSHTNRSPFKFVLMVWQRRRERPMWLVNEAYCVEGSNLWKHRCVSPSFILHYSEVMRASCIFLIATFFSCYSLVSFRTIAMMGRAYFSISLKCKTIMAKNFKYVIFSNLEATWNLTMYCYVWIFIS